MNGKAKHTLELLAQPLDTTFHPRDAIVISSNIDGDVTIFDYSDEDAGTNRGGAIFPEGGAIIQVLVWKHPLLTCQSVVFR